MDTGHETRVANFIGDVPVGPLRWAYGGTFVDAINGHDSYGYCVHSANALG